MNPETIIAFIQAGSLLVSAGASTVDEVKAMFGAHAAMTDDDLNAILEGIGQDAERRKKIAEGDAGEASGESDTGGSSAA